MTTAHHCHARGCDKQVPPRMLMCGKHWKLVPRPIQDAIWAAYRPGQEVDKRPSLAWVDAAKRAIDVVDQRERGPKRGEVAPGQLGLFGGRQAALVVVDEGAFAGGAPEAP